MMLPEGEFQPNLRSYAAADKYSATDSGKKVVLSDLEKQARKEENARRRKLQMDQKMENDRVRSSSLSQHSNRR